MKHVFIGLMLSPILLCQGLYVRRSIIKLPEPDGERNGKLGVGKSVSVLVLGDSAAAGVGVADQAQALSGVLSRTLAEQFEVDWRLLAKSGATTQSCSESLKQYPPGRIDAVVISLGVNDVTRLKSVSYFSRQTRQLVQQLRLQFSAPLILFTGLPPMGKFPGLPHPLRWFLGQRAQLFDRRLQQLSEELECIYYSPQLPHDPAFIAKDGFHPGAPVYQQWGTDVADLVSQALAPNGA